MPQVTVTIAGKTYRMACGEGEERHLEGLAASFDARIGDMRKAFGEIGDMRLHVMAALTLADELAETKRRIEAMERETAAMRESTDAGSAEREASEARLAETVQRTAERIERLAKRLGPVPGGAQQGGVTRPQDTTPGGCSGVEGRPPRLNPPPSAGEGARRSRAGEGNPLPDKTEPF